jgi:hypothetical protein
MAVVKIEPSNDHPVPYSTDDEELNSFADELVAAANTAELLESLGAPVEVDPATLREEKRLLESAIKDQKSGLLKSLPTALGAAAFLKSYGQSMAMDVVQVRTALTTKLLELADCGDAKYELKAIELLGKHSDIGLFTSKSEININYNSPESLENAIKERVKRLLNAEVVDIKPLGMDLEEELGIYDAEFEEVEVDSDGDIEGE